MKIVEIKENKKQYLDLLRLNFSTNLKLFYLRSINPMIEKINPTIPIPITSSPIPDEQREIIMAKSSIAIPNPIFFIVNPPLQIPICFSISYSNYTIKPVNSSTATLDNMRNVRTVFCPHGQEHLRVTWIILNLHAELSGSDISSTNKGLLQKRILQQVLIIYAPFLIFS